MKISNPYRPFFLIGTVIAIFGAGLWIPYGFHLIDFYPGRIHAHLMMGVFLFSFASGFLMTAIPKMTGTSPSNKTEFFSQMACLFFTGWCAFFNRETELFFISILLNLIILFLFVGKRFLKKQNAPPDIFPFVLAGILSGMLGAILWLMGHNLIGHRLFYLNFILCLVAGVGSKIIPMLLRLGPAKPNSKKVSIFLALILTLACFPDEMEYWSLGPWSRAIAISWIAVFYWRIFESSPFTSWLSRGVRLSAISVLLGSFLLALDFTHKMEWLHLIYISGFGLLTFMVASRVILAHGGHDMKLEIKNWRITFAVVLIFIAGATRAFAPFYPPLYQRHLAYSAICFVLAVVIWGWSFIPKLKIKETFS